MLTLSTLNFIYLSVKNVKLGKYYTLSTILFSVDLEKSLTQCCLSIDKIVYMNSLVRVKLKTSDYICHSKTIPTCYLCPNKCN